MGEQAQQKRIARVYFPIQLAGRLANLSQANLHIDMFGLIMFLKHQGRLLAKAACTLARTGRQYNVFCCSFTPYPFVNDAQLLGLAEFCVSAGPGRFWSGGDEPPSCARGGLAAGLPLRAHPLHGAGPRAGQ